jgi:hypothetical protein
MAEEKTDEQKGVAAKTKRVKRAQFAHTFYEAGTPKYEAGKHYPLTQETRSQIAAGAAREVEVEMDLDAHAAEEKAATSALDTLWADTRKAEAAARATSDLK